MPKKSILLMPALFLSLALFAESVSFTKDSSLSVLAKSYDAEITYSFDEEYGGGEAVLVTVHAFSYSDKRMGDFSFSAQKQKDGSFSAKKQVTKSECDGKQIDVTVSSAKIEPGSQKVEVKFKPGKMPFNIKLKTK